MVTCEESPDSTAAMSATDLLKQICKMRFSRGERVMPREIMASVSRTLTTSS